jgi:hypothetical protein
MDVGQYQAVSRTSRRQSRQRSRHHVRPNGSECELLVAGTQPRSRTHTSGSISMALSSSIVGGWAPGPLDMAFCFGARPSVCV